ncbi:hypothetical protein [Leptothoe spongobia]|uniref:Uncharacterized protein n=1 Tax=Leptothoe spongobia TAU-MAC 1115 TaxID=1967444 RepID=A0A947DDL4_9CYAN|nr:hypothetical protein [Leptothoe spongobia]MBT9314614.1 hypothetical protein [Leptothoe spongobia TAU-MAC 1115]
MGNGANWQYCRLAMVPVGNGVFDVHHTICRGVRRIIICKRRNGHRTYQVST